MINFLHTYHPEPILISFGPINIYWYSLFIILGAMAAILITLKLAGYYNIKKETVIDLAFWLIIAGVIGARVYHILLELPFYLAQPLNILMLWQGGLAIHGAIIGGIIVLWLFSKKNTINFWLISALIAPGLALAQAVGRWGNYFNQELFGWPTNLPWGIPIDYLNRPLEYLNSSYFQPAFLYEFLGDLLIFFILIIIYFYSIKNNQYLKENFYKLIVFSYLILYSLLRFSLEFIRVDNTPTILNLRFPQLISVLIIILCFGFLIYNFSIKKPNKTNLVK